MQTSELSPEVMEELRASIARDVAGGFTELEYAVEGAVEMASEEHEVDSALLEPVAERIAREALAAHLAAQAAWPAVTDCDRLDRAFAELERGGIVARQHFACCSTCGFAEIGGEMAGAEAEGTEVRGFAFYHAQDTECAVEGGGLCVAYGAAEEGEEATLAIGREVAAALQRHGLTVEWDGSANRKIGVEMEWKRRWPFDA